MMKEYQAPQVEVVTFEVNDVVTLDKSAFDSFNLGEWNDNDKSNINTIGNTWG